MRNTLIKTLQVMQMAAAFFQNKGKIAPVQHPGTLRRGHLNPQGIDLFYMSKAYRSQSNHQPHSGKRQQRRHLKKFISDSEGNITQLPSFLYRTDREVDNFLGIK